MFKVNLFAGKLHNIQYQYSLDEFGKFFLFVFMQYSTIFIYRVKSYVINKTKKKCLSYIYVQIHITES